MKYSLTALLLLGSLWSAAQLLTVDDFGDGDLLNPDWTGDTDQFVVEEGKLKSLATNPSPVSITLATPTNARAATLTFEFLVEMDFSPSGSNFAEVVLADDRSEFGAVYLRFGGISGSGDALVVEITDSESMVTQGFTGRAGALGAQPAVVRFQLRRELTETTLEWVLLTDYSGGTDFTEEGRFPAPFVAPNSFQVICNFTQTRADRFSFDDLLVRSEGRVDEPVLPTFTTPTAERLIINEFLVDPNPPVALPPVDFVELYNAGDSTLDLSNVSVASGSDARELAADTLGVGEYLVVFDLPALNVTNDDLTLLLGADTLHHLTYNRTWYNDPDRDDGGYSLEFVGGDGDQNCAGRWRASLDPSGGTPGKVNAVDGRGADVSSPGIGDVQTTTTGVRLTFDEDFSAATLNPAGFTLTGATITSITQSAPNVLDIRADLETGRAYLLTLPPVFSDCAGNVSDFIDLDIFLPGIPTAGDVIINELLFNPATGGARFLELVNCSDRVFDLDGWTLLNTASESSNAEKTINGTRLFRPGDFLVVTPDPADVAARFQNVDTTLLFDQTLPTLGNDDGNITVLDPDGTVLDAFDYTEDYQSPLLSPNDGVSLERLRKGGATNDGNNWFSASSAAGFGTPTRANSQRRDDLPTEPAEGTFSLLSETFSPDGDNFEDVLEIRYRTDAPGKLARITIYDVQGRLVRNLNRTELLGVSGTLRWDGSEEDGRRARTGAYVLLCELFDPAGATSEEKLVAVLAGTR